MEQDFSRVIQGCMTWGVWGKKLSQNEMVARINTCLENGITTFDHADIYGDYTTEQEFGKAWATSGVQRDQVQLISKCGIQYIGKTRDNEVKHYQYDAKYIVWSAEKSISDLKCEYLDLFLLHRPSPLMHPDEIAKAVDQLKGSGKIKQFGVSNFTSSQMDLIGTKNLIEANQFEFSLTAHQAMLDGTLDYMMKAGIRPMCWSPLGSVFRTSDAQTKRIRTVLADLIDVYSATEDQLLLAWILQHPAGIHPVIGSTNPLRIKAAAEASEIQLKETDWFKLWVASMGHKVP